MFCGIERVVTGSRQTRVEVADWPIRNVVHNKSYPHQISEKKKPFDVKQRPKEGTGQKYQKVLTKRLHKRTQIFSNTVTWIDVATTVFCLYVFVRFHVLTCF